MSEIPESMVAELAAWNQGRGIDLESWVGCAGNFRLAIGYVPVFWPRFVEFEGYILRDGFSLESLRGFESHCAGDRRAVETVMNHLHIADIQHVGCEDLTSDKAILLGEALREIYEAKLRWQFPGKSCTVSFHKPEDASDVMGYEVSFWQEPHEDPRGSAQRP
jgi:hypothetical protein